MAGVRRERDPWLTEGQLVAAVVLGLVAFALLSWWALVVWR